MRDEWGERLTGGLARRSPTRSHLLTRTTMPSNPTTSSHRRFPPGPALLFAGLVALLIAAAADPGRTAGADAPAKAHARKVARTKTHAPAKADAPAPQIDPMSANAACYVCHMTFITEELSRVHLKEKVDCIKCHGLSAKHANDENVGATKPDKTFKHDQIDKMCAECHDEHDAPARAVVARFLERKLTAKTTACTDCHGTHKIERAAAEGQIANGKPTGR
jgi:hypothetical protein